MSVSHETPRKSKLTYEHYTQLPDDGNRHEIIDGLHYMNPAPIPYHQALSRHIQFQLYSAIELENLGEVINAPIDVQFSNHDVVQPDLVVVLKGNNIATQSKLKGTPNLIVEILSPFTSSRDEGLKKELYEQNKVPEYWVVDHDEKAVRKYVLANGCYSEPTRHTESITCNGLPNVDVDLKRVW